MFFYDRKINNPFYNRYFAVTFVCILANLIIKLELIPFLNM
jgi:hypothetical protein